MEHQEEHEETKTQYFSTTEYSGGDMYTYTAAPAPVEKEPAKRPIILSVICVIAFIAGIIGVLLVLAGVGMVQSGEIKAPDWILPFAILGLAVNTAGYIGIWKMKLWGVYLVAIMFAVSHIVNYAHGQFSPLSFGGSALVLVIILFHAGKMD